MTRTHLARRARRRRLAAVLAASAAVLAVPAAPAAADSIAYVRDGDVWLATGDGARQYRVTSTGGYSDVTQADDGTLVGLHGVRLHRLDRAGTVLADFDTPVSDTRPAGERVFWGPFDPAVSPDGRRLAYTYYYVSKGTAPGCVPPTCLTTVTEGGTAYSHADRATDWDAPGLGRHSGWRAPTWIDDATTMISDPTHVPNADVLIDPVGDGRPGRDGITLDWFSDGGTPHLGAGEMTRRRDALAFQAGDGDRQVRIYRMPAFYPALPQACLEYGATADGPVGAPTWSPDGRRLAWAERDGVRTVDLPDLSAGCTTDGASRASRLVLPGASQPDWGPADVPPGPGRQPAGGGGPDGGTAPGAVPATPGAAGGSPRPAAAPRPSVRVTRATRTRVVVRVRAPGAGRLTVRLVLGGRTLVRARTRAVPAAGITTTTFRLDAAARRRIARSRRGRATVRVGFRAADGVGTVTTRASVTLPRRGR